MLVLVLCRGVEMTPGMLYGSQLQKTTSWRIFPSPWRAMDISQAWFICASSEQFLPRKLYFSLLTIKVEMENFTSYMSTFGHSNPINCGKGTGFRMQLFPRDKEVIWHFLPKPITVIIARLSMCKMLKVPTDGGGNSLWLIWRIEGGLRVPGCYR